MSQYLPIFFSDLSDKTQFRYKTTPLPRIQKMSHVEYLFRMSTEWFRHSHLFRTILHELHFSIFYFHSQIRFLILHHTPPIHLPSDTLFYHHKHKLHFIRKSLRCTEWGYGMGLRGIASVFSHFRFCRTCITYSVCRITNTTFRVTFTKMFFIIVVHINPFS